MQCVTGLPVFIFIILLSVIMLFLCVYVSIYFIKREQRLLNRIQKMLDDAIDGSFEDRHLDESKLSSIENSMWRYLCDNRVAYQKLLEERAQIQTMISDISHQAVIPVTNITVYSQLLEEWLLLKDERPDPEALDEITAIREQADKLDFFLECLVKLSRLETGIIHVKPCRQSLEPVLSEVRKQFITRAADRGIELKVENTASMAVFDLKWTIEALANVVDNAVKYTPVKGTVTIGVESYSCFTCIYVADQGAGIPEKEQANIFTRFYRGSSAGETPGLGIGLYLAREVMKAQNGYIKLSSGAEGGSKFSLFLLNDEMSQK